MTDGGADTPVHDWDPDDYERHSVVQEVWARDCLARLRPRGDERVLDIGCGDGRVSAALAALVPSGAVLGVDASSEMIAHARAKHEGGDEAALSFEVADVRRLPYEGRFDLIVTFNCLHWVPAGDQPAALAAIARALVPRGRAFLHFGARGNIAPALAVVQEVTGRAPWRAAFAGFRLPWCFPEAGDYRSLVEAAGLVPERVEALRRQMVQPDVAAFAGWLRTTWLPYLERLPEDRREAFIDDVVAAFLERWPAGEHGEVRVDAVRLEVEARRP